MVEIQCPTTRELSAMLILIAVVLATTFLVLYRVQHCIPDCISVSTALATTELEPCISTTKLVSIDNIKTRCYICTNTSENQLRDGEWICPISD